MPHTKIQRECTQESVAKQEERKLSIPTYPLSALRIKKHKAADITHKPFLENQVSINKVVLL